MERGVEVAKVDELEAGEMKPVEAGGRTVVMLNVEGDLYAIDDECTHASCSLSDGYLEGEVLECSCHGSMFNVKTGAVVQGPADQPVSSYPVHIDGESVYVTIGESG